MLLPAFVYKFLRRRMFLPFLDIYLEAELPGHVVILFLICGIARLFPKRVVPFYDPTNRMWGFHFVHILTSTCDLPAVGLHLVVGVNWRLAVGEVCPSVKTNDVELLVMCSLGICVSSWEKCSCRSFACFVTGLSPFHCWLVRVLYVFQTQDPYQIRDLQIFFPILWVVFSLFWK